MYERNRLWDVICHVTLLIFVFLSLLPIYVAIVGSTHDLPALLGKPMPMIPGPYGIENYHRALTQGPQSGLEDLRVFRLLVNSTIMALTIAIGKIVISLLSAFAIAFFHFPFRKTAFWIIFATLMLPVEIRIVPTYEVVANFGMVGTFAGLTIPLMASATATFLFRQVFMTIPTNLVDAARMDGSSALQFLFRILLPLSKTNIAALFIIMFLFGWNQYLWPLLVADELNTVVVSIKRMMEVGDSEADWPVVMATTMLALLPPVLVIVVMQRWFVQGLIDVEK